MCLPDKVEHLLIIRIADQFDILFAADHLFDTIRRIHAGNYEGDINIIEHLIH